MISCDDCVTVSDDENTVQAPEVSKNRKRKRVKHAENNNTIETIVIDEETVYHSNHVNDNSNNNEIKSPDSQNSSKNFAIRKTNRIHREDKLFSEFIEKCLDLENSDGMIRVINRSLLNAYEECDEEYRQTEEYRKVLIKALGRLDTDPNHKFSHVKDLVETLKLHKKKKRAQLTTLATNLKENGITQKNKFPRKTRINSIIIDSDDDHTEIPTINLDDYPNEVIVLDEEKENHAKDNTNIQNSQNNYLVPQIEVPWEPSSQIEGADLSTVEHNILPIEYEPPQLTNDTEKIKEIEEKIACWKEAIAQLEETEVDNDSETSPYILCEKYKANVVELYKQLCKLTGEQPVKRRKVRLQALEGHPTGPVRRLETFINDNIGEDGIPPFPDFCDVVKCVVVSNIEDKLGWNRPKVMREANALFTQCGRALQKRRQRREYRDLMARLKVEEPDFDPAEEDPELLRKLEENRKIAVKKESDLLEKYVNLQYLPQQQKLQKSPFGCPNLEDVPSASTPNNSNQITTQNSSEQKIIDKERLKPSHISESISDEDSDFEPPEVKLSQEIEKTDLGIDNKDVEVKVKQEPIDVIQLLEELGDNYTISVIDIEDPYLVIEISSDDDSSDEEIHVDGESDC